MQKEVNSKKKTKTHKQGCFCFFLSLFFQQTMQKKKRKTTCSSHFPLHVFAVRISFFFLLFSKVSFPGVLLWFALFFGWWIRFSHKFTCHCNLLKCIIFSLQVWQYKKGCFFPTKGWSTGFSWILSISNFPHYPPPPPPPPPTPILKCLRKGIELTFALRERLWVWVIFSQNTIPSSPGQAMNRTDR